MMYMPDALRAAIEIMEADSSKFIHRNSFNIASMSFDPEIIYHNIKKYVPDFQMEYQVDPLRQAIAESWPNSLDDTCAREETNKDPSESSLLFPVDPLFLFASLHLFSGKVVL